MAGLGAPLPDRWGKLATGAVAGFMAALTVAAPFAWIGPRYQPPAAIDYTADGEPLDFTPPGGNQPAMRLLGYELDTSETQPGAAVRVTLYWESLAPMDRMWSTFLHLEDSAGLLAGQRDTYPGLGLLATTDVHPGYQWADTYVVPVNSAAYAPELLTVLVGLYDYATCPVPCDRMIASNGESTVAIGEVSLVPQPSDDGVANPVSFDFGGEMALIGYALDRRAARPGETLQLTLYWRGLQTMRQNYTVSAQILGPETHIYGQNDSWPQDGSAPTSTWTPGRIVEDTLNLTISPDTPPGVYMIQIVVYSANDSGGIQRLQLVTEDGRLVDDFVLLTPIRVGE
jgi:hypothetical protein